MSTSRHFISLVVALLLVFSFTTISAQIIAPATQDAYTFSREQQAGKNYGSDSKVWVRRFGDTRGFIRFDLSAVPVGARVAWATLNLNVQLINKEGQISIRKVMGNWDESTLTAYHRLPIGPINTKFDVTFFDTGRIISVDVTALVNELLADPLNDHGIAFTAPIAVDARFQSRESGGPATLTMLLGDSGDITESTQITVEPGFRTIGDPPRQQFIGYFVDLGGGLISRSKAVHLEFTNLHAELGRVVINGRRLQIPYSGNTTVNLEPEVGATVMSLPLAYFRDGENHIVFESGIGNFSPTNIYDDYTYGEVALVFSH